MTSNSVSLFNDPTITLMDALDWAIDSEQAQGALLSSLRVVPCITWDLTEILKQPQSKLDPVAP